MDKSDEENCPPCPPHHFKCARSSICLDPSSLCDGVPDCPDAGDEVCCGLDEFRCSLTRKTCVQMYRVCDGVDDCGDKSDENSDSCRRKSAFSKRPTEMNINQHETTYTYVIVIALMFVLLLSFLAYKCKKKGVHYDEHELGVNDILMGSSRPLNSQGSERRSNQFLNKDNSQIRRLIYPPLIPVISAQQSVSDHTAYDRNNITGASSSTSSSANAYPKETMNPPPSPVTDHSQCHYEGSSCSSQTNSRCSRGPFFPYTQKKRWLQSNRGPPPTPCSTDSEVPQHYPLRVNYYNNSHAELNYDSDPYPPPPTPRSHYFESTRCSVTDASPPGSPCTERSFNPYPPPPSPS